MPSTNGEHESVCSPGRGYSCIRAKFVDGLLSADDKAGTGLWVYPPTILEHTRRIADLACPTCHWRSPMSPHSRFFRSDRRAGPQFCAPMDGFPYLELFKLWYNTAVVRQDTVFPWRDGPMIEAVGLGKDFGSVTAVRDVTLTIAEGEVVVLLGPNGAGKTTTVRMLAAILRPTRGRAVVAGYDVAEDAVEVRRRVGLLTEFPGLYERMSVLDYLAFFGGLHGLSPASCRARGEELLHRFGLWESRRMRLGEFSKGMRQKVALVRALLHDPPVLLLDEPTSAMDPSSARLVRDCIRELRAGGHTLLVCTHNLAEAEELADRIAVIRQGRIIALDTPQGLRRQLLGPPLMEVRWNGSGDNFAGMLDNVQIAAQGPGWARFFSPQPEQINPQVLHRLVAAGAEVVTLSEVPRSLEEVYLHLVEVGEEAGESP